MTALAAALVLSSCGDPYLDDRRDRATHQPPPGEVAAPPVRQPPEPLAPDAPAPTATAAARRAAELTTNWTSTTAANNYDRLVRTSIAAARRDFAQAAARLPTDPQMTAPGARSRGCVEAVAVRDGDADHRRLVVLTHETITADGLTDTRWRVTLATAQQRAGGWVIARWEPQP